MQLKEAAPTRTASGELPVSFLFYSYSHGSTVLSALNFCFLPGAPTGAGGQGAYRQDGELDVVEERLQDHREVLLGVVATRLHQLTHAALGTHARVPSAQALGWPGAQWGKGGSDGQDHCPQLPGWSGVGGGADSAPPLRTQVHLIANLFPEN